LLVEGGAPMAAERKKPAALEARPALAIL